MAKNGNFILICAISMILTQDISALTDNLGCNKLLCPPIKEIDCPEDSFRAIYHPPNDIDHITGITTIPDDQITESNQNITTTNLPNNNFNNDNNDINDSNHTKRSLPENDLKNENDDCCPFSICTCKEVCDIPSCHNTSLVLIESKPAYGTPAECCAEYECDIEPNCTEVYNTKGSWLIDCQQCQCLAGQKICHRSCDEIHQPPGNCLSQSLKRSFFNGDVWKEDECTQCECRNGDKKCQTSFCRALNCPNKIKLPGECCPICATNDVPSSLSPDIIIPITIPTPAVKQESITPHIDELPCRTTTTDMPAISIYTENLGGIDTTKRNCILYGIIVALGIMAVVFLGLYCRERSKQRSYRPVPIFDSNFNKIKSIVTA